VLCRRTTSRTVRSVAEAGSLTKPNRSSVATAATATARARIAMKGTMIATNLIAQISAINVALEDPVSAVEPLNISQQSRLLTA